MKKFNMYKVEESDLALLKSKKLGERLKWIREKANEYNPSSFTVYRLAKSISISQSTISRIETGDTQPGFEVMVKIADQLGVSTDVFADSFYRNGGASFIICGKLNEDKSGKANRKKSGGVDLLDITHEATVSLTIKTIRGRVVEETQRVVPLSPLDREEFKDEIFKLVEKVENRRIEWKKLQAIHQQLKDNPGSTNNINKNHFGSDFDKWL